MDIATAVSGAFFYLFAVVLVGAAFMVITARNPVHAVLFLILAFFNAAGLFILLGAEFLAMILVIVYVGAVAVLFLFVVMMLDVDFAELRAGFMKYMPVGALVGGVLMAELVFVLVSWALSPEVVGRQQAAMEAAAQAAGKGAAAVSNTEALGLILYTKHVYFFQAAGLILLVAMIGAIVLTLHHKANVRRQNIAEQVARSPQSAVEVVKVETGKGL